jgi:hypothetical protein
VGKWGDRERPYSFDLAQASTSSLASAIRLWGDLRPGESFPAAGAKVRCFCPYHQHEDDEASAGFIVNLKDGRVKLHCFATNKSWSMADWWAYAVHGVPLGALKPAWLNSWDRRLQRSQGLIGDPIPELDVPDDYSEQETRVIRRLHERIMLEDGEPVSFEYQYGACWCGLSFSEFANTWKRLGRQDAITAIEGTSPEALSPWWGSRRMVQPARGLASGA